VAVGSASLWMGDGVVRVPPSQVVAAGGDGVKQGQRQAAGGDRARRAVGLQCCGEERDSPGMSVPSAGIAKRGCRCNIC
jgi:hypothetical protein